MDGYQKDWERHETRRKVLLAFMIVEFLIPFWVARRAVRLVRGVPRLGASRCLYNLDFGTVPLSSLREKAACHLQEKADQLHSLRAGKTLAGC